MKYGKEYWDHYITLLDTIGHWELLCRLTIILHPCKLAIMELSDQSDEVLRTAKLVHNLPQPIMADCVRGFGQVHKGNVAADILFLTLLLQLSCKKCHIYHYTSLAEATLTLWQQFLLYVLFRLLSRILARISTAVVSRERPLWLSQAHLFPFHL